MIFSIIFSCSDDDLIEWNGNNKNLKYHRHTHPINWYVFILFVYLYSDLYSIYMPLLLDTLWVSATPTLLYTSGVLAKPTLLYTSGVSDRPRVVYVVFLSHDWTECREDTSDDNATKCR